MIRFLIIIPIIIIGLIVGISLYLQPNDLIGCSEKPDTTTSCSPVDAIVAVSGGDTNARTDEAIRMYKNGWSQTLVFSGAAEDKTGLSNAQAMKLRAREAGVPVVAIVIDELSETTKENAENSKTIFETRDIQRIMLVTSGYHQRRASLEFHKYAPDVTIVNHSVASDRDWSWLWWTGPRGWTLAVTEVFKTILFHAGVSQ